MKEVFRTSTFRFDSLYEVQDFLVYDEEGFTWAELKEGDKTYELLIDAETNDIKVDRGDYTEDLCEDEVENVLGYKDINYASNE